MRDDPPGHQLLEKLMRFEPATVTVISFILIPLAGVLVQDRQSTTEREPIVGMPCEGCEAIFEGLPDTLQASIRLAPEDEPGEAMRVEGSVYDRHGNTVSGVIVYAYHTNARGMYPRDEHFRGQAAYFHGRLRAWAKTDEHGRYQFESIRPASYPDNEIPAHVHMHVLEVGRCTYYIDSIHFTDDAHLTRRERRELAGGRGGSGLVTPVKDGGIWIMRRDIVLGENIPGYPDL